MSPQPDCHHRRGADEPVWSHSGRELFYISEGHLVAAEVVGLNDQEKSRLVAVFNWKSELDSLLRR